MTAASYIHTLILNCIYDASFHSIDRKTCNSDRRVVQSPEILLQVVILRMMFMYVLLENDKIHLICD